MESIGTLAGGIAHDFNNLLNIVQSYATLMRTDLKNPLSLEQHLEVIEETVKEGTVLTQQLLTVARKTNVQFGPTSINRLIMTAVKWLESTLPKTIKITADLDPSIPHILADASQLNQVLLNLCLNARDAVSEAGTLRLSTTMIAGDAMRDRFSEIENRNYVCVAVADTGPGMDENIRQHIFEPFFTTKPEGKGTGFGLSIVYGIVKSHHGFIDVDTRPGHGSTFRIYLPVAD
jgi:two-component system, cell cycle sensor histidine kinase and response regulator CckA